MTSIAVRGTIAGPYKFTPIFTDRTMRLPSELFVNSSTCSKGNNYKELQQLYGSGGCEELNVLIECVVECGSLSVADMFDALI